ncbi:ribonuclease H1 [Andrena cerasifolii]|uniref:ribonuclease H1 n=1 Tax=Andrena cerasifolii TaxID=2819439 RepID=UPI0040376164
MKIPQLSFLCSTLRNMAPSYYAVAKGRKPGIYSTWDQCKTQVHQYSGPVYKKFSSQAEAENFIKQNANSTKGNKLSVAAPAFGKRSLQQRSASSDASNEKPSSKKRKLIVINELNSECTAPKKTPSDYIIDKDGYVNVYTDGACSKNGRKGSRAGIGVWFGDDHPMNVSKALEGRATNNHAEIQAVTVAARQAKKAGIENLKINTDSQFLLYCIQTWMPKWKNNGWKTVSNKPVINKVELLEMEEALVSLNIKWNHVNGHVGIYGNEMADKLARAGCLEY